MKCKVAGCDREAMYKKDCVCQKHYFRFMRYGTYELTKLGKKKYRTQNQKGYQMLYEPEHPLAMANGNVYEHRYVIYSKYGENLPNCDLCGCKLTWDSSHIDHINGDVKDNRLENLRPICRACNVMRSHSKIPKYTHKRHSKITFNGITMTAAEWARQPNVSVAGNTINRRIKNGWSVKDALFSKSTTHPNICVSGYKTKYKNAFEMNANGVELD